MSSAPQTPHDDEKIRPHTYDGIQEYDKRLPNWWLFTLYASIVFSFFYWLYFHTSGVGPSQEELFAAAMQQAEAARLAGAMGDLDNDRLWEMSRIEAFITAGRSVYVSTCAACHGNNLEGGIGNSLVDGVWIHGGTPLEILRVVNEGVLEKGMPAWAGVLGERRTAEVTAYILSRQP